VQEALSDAQQALGDLMRGLEQLSWMGRWFNDNVSPSQGVYDLRRVFEGAKRRIKFGDVTFEAPADECLIRGGDALERLIELLVANGHQHAPQKTVHVRAIPGDEGLLIEIEDEGRPLREDLQPQAFSLEGQMGLKGVAAGRYGRVAGLFVASILAQAAGARLDAVNRDGKNVFRVSTAKV
jgi:signal transduction histidine kinase